MLLLQQANNLIFFNVKGIFTSLFFRHLKSLYGIKKHTDIRPPKLILRVLAHLVIDPTARRCYQHHHIIFYKYFIYSIYKYIFLHLKHVSTWVVQTLFIVFFFVMNLFFFCISSLVLIFWLQMFIVLLKHIIF